MAPDSVRMPSYKNFNNMTSVFTSGHVVIVKKQVDTSAAFKQERVIMWNAHDGSDSDKSNVFSKQSTQTILKILLSLVEVMGEINSINS